MISKLKLMIRNKKFIISFFAIAVIGSAGLFTYMGTPNGCLICHEMAPFYDSWKASAHQEVDCHGCHSSDIGSYVHELIVHIQGVDPSEIEADPEASSSNQQCLLCHKSFQTQSETPSEISCISCHEIDHYDHIMKIDGDYDCSICHGDHTMTVKEETCRTCHSQ